MIDFLNSFKSLIKVEKVNAENNVFKLHYKLTVILLILFSILLTSKQYFGDPINCNVEEIKPTWTDTYCWIYGTYIIKRTLTDDKVAGLGNELENMPPPWIKDLQVESYDKIIWQKYYQWVCIIFCFQALLFYIPRYIWKTWEGGRLRLLVKDLTGPLISPTWNQEVKRELIQYMLSGQYSHTLYAFRYAFCECLNFINVIMQIYLMDWFLTGQFSLYGVATLTFSKINPMSQVFPKLTKCKYYFYGPSGTIVNRDALCILPLNVLNEKLFLTLWFWFFALAFLSLLALIYRACVICFPRFRIYLLMAQVRFIRWKQAKMLINEMTYGDFFLLYHIGKNVNPLIYKDIILGIHEVMSNKKTYKGYPECIIDEI